MLFTPWLSFGELDTGGAVDASRLCVGFTGERLDRALDEVADRGGAGWLDSLPPTPLVVWREIDQAAQRHKEAADAA